MEEEGGRVSTFLVFYIECSSCCLSGGLFFTYKLFVVPSSHLNVNASPLEHAFLKTWLSEVFKTLIFTEFL